MVPLAMEVFTGIGVVFAALIVILIVLRFIPSEFGKRLKGSKRRKEHLQDSKKYDYRNSSRVFRNEKK